MPKSKNDVEMKECTGLLCRGKKRPITDFRHYRCRGTWQVRGICQKCENLKRRLKENGLWQNEDNKDNIPLKLEMYTPECFGNALAQLCDWKIDEVDVYTETKFVERTNSKFYMIYNDIAFKEIKEEARKQIEERGLLNPSGVEITEPGLYFIIGDSHGKHMKREMFDLLNNLSEEFQPNRIFHIGHILDDDDNISNLFRQYDNFTVVAKQEELKTVHKLEYDIIRDYLYIGNLLVSNQNQITDYVKTRLYNVHDKFLEGRAVTNLHRHEFFSKCNENTMEKGYICSPGCMCEPHVIKTVKQIDFVDGFKKKETYTDSYKQYRRWKEIARSLWQQGMVAVRLFDDGKAFIVPMEIKTTDTGEKVTGFFDKIITSRTVKRSDKVDFFTTDEHLPHINTDVAKSQDHIADKYKPDRYNQLGDLSSSDSFNHWELDKNNIKYIADKDTLDDIAAIRYHTQLRRKWADKMNIMLGNHGRFVRDWLEKNPQFSSLFNMEAFLNDSSVNVVPLKKVLKLGQLSCIHGELKPYKAHGGWYKKLSNSLKVDPSKGNLITGHNHFWSKRMGVITMGVTGNMTQEYADEDISSCNNGCAMGVHYKDVSVVTMIMMESDGRCWDGETLYAPREDNTREDIPTVPEYEFELSFNFK